MSLAERLRHALESGHDSETVLLTGDHLDPDQSAAPMQAAVLVAVTDRPEPGVILTQRTETLSRHPGQIAFPGGRIDPGEPPSHARPGGESFLTSAAIPNRGADEEQVLRNCSYCSVQAQEVPKMLS